MKSLDEYLIALEVQIADNVYKGFSFIVCLTIRTFILMATLRPHTAGLHQIFRKIYTQLKLYTAVVNCHLFLYHEYMQF